MDDVIKKLTAAQAFEIVKRLSEKGGEIAKVLLAEASNLLMAVDLNETADEVFRALDSIDVQDCWARSGKSRYGYTEPSEAAVELVEEELRPFYDQAARYRELGMTEQNMTYSMGVILGIYRYEHESKSEFRKWCEDVPIESLGVIFPAACCAWNFPSLSDFDTPLLAAGFFIQRRCPTWASYLIPKRDVGRR